MHDYSAGSLQQRLDDYGGNVVMTLFQQARERARAVNIASGALFSDRTAETMRRGHAQDGKSELLKRGDKIGIGADGHSSSRVAMVGVLQRDESRLARFAEVSPELQGHFEGDFHSGRAVVGKKDVLERLGEDAPQAHGKLFGRVVRESGKDHVLELAGLFRDGFGDQRMRVAVEIHPPGGDSVDQLAAVARIEIDALAALDAHGLRVERFLRKGMPDGKWFSRHFENIADRNGYEIRPVVLAD